MAVLIGTFIANAVFETALLDLLLFDDQLLLYGTRFSQLSSKNVFSSDDIIPIISPLEVDKKIMESKFGKAMNAVNDARQHLSSLTDFERLETQYIDRILARMVDLPTDSKQKNTRRNLQMIREWMVADGCGVVLLEVLGQLYWRLGDLNSKDFEILKKSLRQQQSYLDLVQSPQSATLVMQRIKHVQECKFNAFDILMQELDSEFQSCDLT